jgi:hypothetical protein
VGFALMSQIEQTGATMRRQILLPLGLMALIALLASCGPDAKSAPAILTFEAPMNVDASQRFHVSLGVRNVGEARFRDYEAFNGTMALRDAGGEEVGRIQVATLWELAAGNAGWPAAYASTLPAGAYKLTWGAPDYGSVTVDFTLVELEGWLYLGQESIQSTSGASPHDEREYGSLESLADLARVNLAQRLGVDPEAVTVQGIEEVEFPDASLGVPEPDTSYAQIITPGYALTLAAEGQTYEYRASDARLVFAPQEGGAPQDSTLLPTLAIEEHAIVDSEVDGPGHVEYTGRLGDDILARIEGLRARAAEQQLAATVAALAPFGYRLEAKLDAEWNQTFYDLFREGEAEPLLAGLSHLWPISVNASSTDFLLPVENAPNATPLYLQVQAGSVEPWGAELSNWLAPAYVGDALARVTYTGFPTITYQVELGDRPVYTGTAVAMGAYMPLISFAAWDGHWVLEVDDHLIMDGQDLGQALGYDAAFGFHLIGGQPFYFFAQDGQIRISFGARTLPNVYDMVFHNQCCEASMHNVQALGDSVLFHALWNGTWYFVEAGVYDGEMAGTYRYTAPEGWSFRYPMHWDRLDEELGLVQDTATGKTLTFASQPATEAELARWLESEIDRKLAATEAKNTMAEPLTTSKEGALTIYRYAILSRLESSEILLRTTVFFDGQRRYEFHAGVPPMAEEEYEAIVASFRPAGK